MARGKQGPWVFVDEVMEFFQCCRSKAYAIIKDLNDELEARGFLTYPGRVSRKYFNERYYA